MRKVIAVTLLLGAGCLAQVSSNVSLSNGVQLSITCNLDRDGSLKIDLAPASGNSFYRIFRDENSLTVFAYELLVERTPDGDYFLVTAKPAGREFAARFPNADGRKPTPTLGESRQSPLLASGDQFTIELPVIPGIAEKLSDVVQIRLNQRGASPDQASQVPLRLVGLSVQINGQPASPSGPGATVAGRFVMFYLPGRGAYFLSSESVQSPAFVKIGVVDGTRLHFTLDNDTYDCISEEPILSRSERGETWVFHDPNYKSSGNWASSNPSNPQDEFYTAAGDSLKWWLP